MANYSFSLEDIAELLDRMLEKKLEEKLEEKLQPIRQDLANIKFVVEREFKKVHEEIQLLNERVDLLEMQLGTIIEDYEPRLQRIEKKLKISLPN